MRAINLLPRDDRRSRQRKPPSVVVLVGVVSGVALSALLCGWFLLSSSAVTEQRTTLDGVLAELAATPPPPAKQPGNEALEQEKAARLTSLGTVLSARQPWDRVFRELSLVLPEDVWLSSLQASSPSSLTAPPPAPGQTAAAGGLAITGSTYSHDAVARLLARLALVPQLSNVELKGSKLAETSGRRSVEFTIAAGMRGAQVATP